MSKRNNKRLPELPNFNEVEIQDYLVNTKKWFLEGVSRSEMLMKISSLNPDFTEKDIHYIYSKTVKFFEEQMFEIIDLQDVVDRHINEYEKLYQYFESKDNLWGKRKCMTQKERLLGLLKDDNVIEFNQINNTVIKEESEYSLSKLTETEQKRFIELFNKTTKKNV